VITHRLTRLRTLPAARRRAAALAVIAGLAASCAPRPRVHRVPPVVDTHPIAYTAPSWPRREVLDLALQAFRCGRTLGVIERPLLTVIDYSLPSTERRLWVIDLARRRVLFHELVAHGQNSGDDLALTFSNRLGSRQSSLGLFRADESYEGEHGLALRLSGLEPGVNDRARDRSIVIHGAEYVSDDYIATHGRLGRSWGCPAVPATVHAPLIEQIRDGSAVFAYYPDAAWLQTSRFLHCDADLANARFAPPPPVQQASIAGEMTALRSPPPHAHRAVPAHGTRVHSRSTSKHTRR
jgi:hypothetical protein